MDMQVDIVYLWVDGSALGFDEKIKSLLSSSTKVKSADQIGIRRFRNNDELLYSLRSVHLFAPWARRIHVVTEGLHPSWLNTRHDKIAIVTHEQIFRRKRDLPVFNSNAIEMNLHRIPDLAKKFLYFNDDLFLGRPVALDDFVTDAGGHIFYLEPNPILQYPDCATVHDRAYCYTRTTVQDQWPDVEISFLPAHCPQLYDRDHLGRLEQQFQEAFDRTSGHAFRDPEDLVLRILYHAFLSSHEGEGKEHRSRLLSWGSPDYSLIMMERKPIAMVRAFSHIVRRRPKFFCINDDLGVSVVDRCILKLQTYFLEKMYPEKSCFEI
jgi:hypothetical protein